MSSNFSTLSGKGSYSYKRRPSHRLKTRITSRASRVDVLLRTLCARAFGRRSADANTRSRHFSEALAFGALVCIQSISVKQIKAYGWGPCTSPLLSTSFTHTFSFRFSLSFSRSSECVCVCVLSQLSPFFSKVWMCMIYREQLIQSDINTTLLQVQNSHSQNLQVRTCVPATIFMHRKRSESWCRICIHIRLINIWSQLLRP